MTVMSSINESLWLEAFYIIVRLKLCVITLCSLNFHQCDEFQVNIRPKNNFNFSRHGWVETRHLYRHNFPEKKYATSQSLTSFFLILHDIFPYVIIGRIYREIIIICHGNIRQCHKARQI
jgi:hypothetical protein